MFSNSVCFENYNKKKKIKNRSASLRYAGPILTFYGCTGANLSRYNSSVHGTFCGKITPEKNTW